MKGIINDFKVFLKEYKVVSLAVAFIMGGAINTLVKSLVNDVIMPLVTPFVPGGGWQEATLLLGPFVIRWGSFFGEAINFLILAFVVFMIVKILIKEDKK